VFQLTKAAMEGGKKIAFTMLSQIRLLLKIFIHTWPSQINVMLHILDQLKLHHIKVFLNIQKIS